MDDLEFVQKGLRICLSGPTDVVLVGMNQPQYVNQVFNFDQSVKLSENHLKQMFKTSFMQELEFVSLYPKEVLEENNITKKQPDTQWDY
jgi:hypothetical protein